MYEAYRNCSWRGCVLPLFAILALFDHYVSETSVLNRVPVKVTVMIFLHHWCYCNLGILRIVCAKYEVVLRLGTMVAMDLITDDILKSSVLDQPRNSKDCQCIKHERAVLTLTVNLQVCDVTQQRGPTTACRKYNFISFHFIYYFTGYEKKQLQNMFKWYNDYTDYKVKPVDSTPCRITKCEPNHNRVDLLKYCQ